MEKIFLILCVFCMQSAVAGGDIQMILDKVHENSFYGCDSAIPKFIQIYGNVQYVETKLVNDTVVDGIVANRPNPNNASRVQVDVAIVSDNISEIQSYLIQKYNGKCYAKNIQAVINYPKIRCDQAIAANSMEIVNRTGSFIWVSPKWAKNGDDTVIMLDNGVGGCTYVYRDRGWGIYKAGIDIDQVR